MSYIQRCEQCRALRVRESSVICCEHIITPDNFYIWNRENRDWRFAFIPPNRWPGPVFLFYCATCGFATWITASVTTNFLEPVSRQHEQRGHHWDAFRLVSTESELPEGTGHRIFEEVRIHYLPPRGRDYTEPIYFTERLTRPLWFDASIAFFQLRRSFTESNLRVFFNGRNLVPNRELFFINGPMRHGGTANVKGIGIPKNILTGNFEEVARGHNWPCFGAVTLNDVINVQYMGINPMAIPTDSEPNWEEISAAREPQLSPSVSEVAPTIPNWLRDHKKEYDSTVKSKIEEYYAEHQRHGGKMTPEQFQESLTKSLPLITKNVSDFNGALAAVDSSFKKFVEELATMSNNLNLAEIEQIRTELLTEPLTRVVSKDRRM